MTTENTLLLLMIATLLLAIVVYGIQIKREYKAGNKWEGVFQRGILIFILIWAMIVFYLLKR